MTAVAVAVALAATGCGSGGSSGGSSDEFVQQANRICAQRQEELDALESPSTNDDYVDLVDQAQPVNENALKKLKALKPPSDMKDDADELWTMIEAQNVDLTQLQSAARMDDDAGVDKILTKLDDRSDEFDAKAESLGLTDCTSGGGGGSDGGAGTTVVAGGDDQVVAGAVATVEKYLEAYFSGDVATEKTVSALWADQYRLLRAIGFESAAVPDPANIEVTIDTSGVTGVSEDEHGLVLDGKVVATTPEVTHTYTDILLVEKDGTLAVADYCRTNPKGVGPLDGCLSDSAGKIGQKSTSDDGTVSVSLSPIFRVQGTGQQALYIGLVIDNQGTAPVRILGGPLVTSLMFGAESGSVPSTSAEEVPVAQPGQKVIGRLVFNSPGKGSDRQMPAGTLQLRIVREGLDEYETGTFDIPALPQDLFE